MQATPRPPSRFEAAPCQQEPPCSTFLYAGLKRNPNRQGVGKIPLPWLLSSYISWKHVSAHSQRLRLWRGWNLPEEGCAQPRLQISRRTMVRVTTLRSERPQTRRKSHLEGWIPCRLVTRCCAIRIFWSWPCLILHGCHSPIAQDGLALPFGFLVHP